jgi:arsenate reductase
MKKMYHLGTCNTCQRILSELNLPEDVSIQDIKTHPISPEDLERMRELAGSYEALFSKRARLYKARNLKDQTLVEADFKNLILEHYTFLKRPVLIYNSQIFIGNAARTVSATKEALQS